MLNSIARHFSSTRSLLAAPFRAAWRLIVRLFPEQEFSVLTMPTGNVSSFHRTSFWRFARGCAKFGLFAWAIWATYVFVYHQPLLQERTAQLEAVRAEHARQMSDLITYHKKFTELNRELNVLDDKILNAKKAPQKTIDDMMKKRLNVWAELDLLQARLNQIYTENHYSTEFTRLSELSLEYELVRAENTKLAQRNKDLTEGAQRIAEADAQITDRVGTLAKDQLAFLQKEMKKISGTLASLGLSEKTIASRAQLFASPLVGSAVAPISLDPNLDGKYQALADKLELWHGLSRAREIMPLGAPVEKPRITSPYGTRTDPIDGTADRKHKGIDFGGPIGTPLLSPAPGKVIAAGNRVGYGKTIEINHGLGFTTLYAHLSKINVRKGDLVRAREVVGLGGSSGRSTGPHLHYEIRYNGTPFNPYSFVKGR